VTSTDKFGVADDAATLSPEVHLRLLRRMIEIRVFEEETQRLFTKGLVRGSTHLCSGQEAVTVGACSALRGSDSMLCSYRGHGAVLAKGAPLDKSFGEILGRAPGLCAGKGGSMHLTDISVGAYGSFAIVGAHLPVAVGLALASVYSGTEEVCVCFFGDGAVNIGAFHEAMNLASIWKLPVIFVCENNLYGEFTPLATTTPVDQLVERASGYAMHGERVDGNDIRAVHRVVGQAADRGRAGEGPTFLEALTYRHKGHSRTDPATYRPDGELEEWLKRDPIVLSEGVLLEQGVSRADLAQVHTEAETSVREAVERALSWPEPRLESLFEDVLA
jgi:TPP-dependent pyruvate/acetoin dehydrogenase alpha subunit